MTSATTSPPGSPLTNASSAEVSSTTSATLALARNVASTIGKKFVHETYTFRDELADHCLGTAHGGFWCEKMDFSIFQSREQNIAILQAQRIAKSRRNFDLAVAAYPDLFRS